VLDEPNSNLDAEGDASLNRTIADLKNAGTTVVVVGHRLSTFAAVDNLLVLVEGAVQHWGRRSEVLEKITRRKFHPVPVTGTSSPVSAPDGAQVKRMADSSEAAGQG
jgi:ABC-type protease/lipase transport system fused ATPase/permease subunit